ncbi:ubiquinone biosynthesis O-methyltransferase [Methylocella silvestris BL2]|uniref:Ubiquinone biosynthesis O-methyltransferase n=1 Tax=Methylocella silvestris (strain DSM 15510 / CIP 108128 / LMG 27833 / NCIMB 13906 / BL2) TaxID=395965 RepID=UBIG_METSB|nr:bifunctional 2-polyprenyl-6-hydroxyphenol methylase/3-demethylubiquinol 3-O-methyltransferase UbiG [Methylocella silvestris]B8EI29.1 RecName: Full=Ubiquinone biosynthesis O-methyltransferase; AltName: Full=2-polyprenyl-6-hydroxyphenol methylase; AltName: Full=3-demethylubiquinone 3-O-methyltransferase [Methylocella silvestris BL2]ACK50511.1 ubiquinone biosynthesis O-methyltransferase [Methylocella silvestris BL2]
MAQREEAGPSSVDPEDVARFDRIGEDWWSADGPMAALHKLNPVRVAYLRDLMSRHFRVEGLPRDRYAPRPLEGLRILDAGCGAGLLAEPLARLGARVTAIDPAPRNIEVARRHAEKSGLSIDYRMTTIEALSGEAATFDAVLAMEVLEHVLDVAGFVRCCGALVRPGGLMFAATLNRTLKSFAFAIVGAEYVLGWAPRGTHDWRRFISPRELARAMAAADLSAFDETGVVFDPLQGGWRLAHDTDINYMMAASKRR